MRAGYGKLLDWAVAASLAIGIASASYAAPVEWRTECIGYYIVELPGNIEFAVQRPPFTRSWEPQFTDGLGVWQTRFEVASKGAIDGSNEIEISSAAAEESLAEAMAQKNRKQQSAKDDYLRKAKLFDDSPNVQKELLDKAGKVLFYKPINDVRTYGMYGDDAVNFDVLVNNRIVSARRKLVGTPRSTIDDFLTNYLPRAPFDLPREPGVCLPYFFMTGEVHQATTGISLRLKDRPDIVIYLHDQPVDKAQVDVDAFVNKAVQRGYFYGAKYTEPMDGNLRPFRSIKIDGREGLGGFARITRNPAQQSNIQIANTANKDQDWGYLAYIPGDKNAPPGTSSDLIFKVERFGRFAKEPMSEKEFRDLVKTLAAGIKRRPGAWVPR